jgi:hypothetical protein
MEDGTGTYYDIIQAIYFAVDNGANVISMSLGGSGYSVAMEEAVDYAVTNGVIVLAAAGNDDSNNQVTPNYPSSLANCISVGAMSPCGLRKTPSTCDGETWWGSNYGDLDFITPGTRIYTTDITGSGGYTAGNYISAFNGTSAATPFAAGVAALALSVSPGLTPIELRESMRYSSVDVGDQGYDPETGFGRLDALPLLTVIVDDSIAPNPISDVTVSDAGTVSVLLNWTATGASADSGKAFCYDIRYAEFEIDSASFETATRVGNAPRPAMAGEPESFWVTNLQPATTWYFAIKACDSFNYSKISNVVEATTLPAPVINFSPDSLYAAILSTDSVIQQLTVDNVAGGNELITNISVVGKAGISVSRNKANDLIRTDLLAEEFSAELPVNHDQTFVNSSQKTLPFYDGFESGSLNEWIIDSENGINDIIDTNPAKGQKCHYIQNTATGHNKGIHQQFENGSQPNYISAYIKSGSTSLSDAYLVFKDQSGSQVIWFYAKSNGMLFVNEDVGGDNTYPYNANVWYHIEFKDIDWIDKDFDYYVNGTLVKADISFINSGSVTDISYLYLYNYSISEAWWDEIAVGENLTWLTTDKSVLTIGEGLSEEVGVKMNASGLYSGFYEADLLLTSNDPAKPEVRVPVSMHVTAVPDIEVSPASIDFGDVFL